jgi:hypothetical protein
VRRGRSRAHTASRGVSPSPSRRAESCASALRAIKYLEVEARVCGWVGGSGPPGPGGEKDRCSKAQAQVVRPTNSSEAGAMVVSWLWMLLRPAAVRRVPPGRLTALLFLGSLPIQLSYPDGATACDDVGTTVPASEYDPSSANGLTQSLSALIP